MVSFLESLLSRPIISGQRVIISINQTVGNLDKRGDGDVWTMTVDEYLKAARAKFIYRLFRHPVFSAFLIAGLFNFYYWQVHAPDIYQKT
ncbi:MAG: hypothetical protein R2764_13615 [Bacteroidales bacterium]